MVIIRGARDAAAYAGHLAGDLRWHHGRQNAEKPFIIGWSRCRRWLEAGPVGSSGDQAHPCPTDVDADVPAR